MIYEYEFWNDDGSHVGTAFCDDDGFIMIAELGRKRTSIIKKDGKIFDDAIKYLQLHEYTYLSSDKIYDIVHTATKIESRLAREIAYEKGWIHDEEIEREYEELTKMFLEE